MLVTFLTNGVVSSLTMGVAARTLVKLDTSMRQSVPALSGSDRFSPLTP